MQTSVRLIWQVGLHRTACNVRRYAAYLLNGVLELKGVSMDLQLIPSFFITSVSGLKIKSDLGRGEKIGSSVYLTNNKKKIEKEIHPEVNKIIGTMEYKSIFESNAIIYSKEPIPADLTPEEFLVGTLYKVEKFFSVLWMFKDNCANNEFGFLLYSIGGVLGVSSNFISIVNSTSQGETKADLSITRADLKKVGSFCKKNLDDGNVYSRPATQLLKGNDRISRAYYLIQAARTQSDLAIKISNYCTAFESLFATSTSELTHKLAERVAFFLENDGHSRIDTFQAMKKAYSVRSTTVHGGTLKESFIEELKQISKKCDGLIRRALLCVLKNEQIREIFLGSSEQIDQFFLDLIFGKHHLCDYYPNKKYKETSL